MRLTTKIILGIISVLFLIPCLFIVGFSFSDRKYTSIKYGNISQDNQVEIELDTFRVVFLDYKEKSENYVFYPEVTLLAQSAQEKNKLVIPEEMNQFTSFTISNDTLKIVFDNTRLRQMCYPNDEYKKNDIYEIIPGANIRLYTHSVDIVSNLNVFNARIEGITTDQMKIDASGRIDIDSCEANVVTSLRPQQFYMRNSTVKTVNLDLNLLSSRNIENCVIDTENLMGRGSHYIGLTRSEARIMNWIPQDKNSSLQVTLYGDTAKVVFKNP